MKTQLSRNSHRPEKRYSGVYQQQGRMVTDADWNELVDVLRQQLIGALKDVVGDGAPAGADPLVTTDGSDLFIRAGRLYVDGIKAELIDEAPIAYTNQADFPDAPPLEDGAFQLYADIWERPVTALEDIAMRDPALHGADTCTRARTMVQLKWMPQSVVLDNVPGIGSSRLSLGLRSASTVQDTCDPCADEIATQISGIKTGNYLFRVEIHGVKMTGGQVDELTIKWSSENGAEQHRIGNEPDVFKGSDWTYDFFNQEIESHLGVHAATPSADFPARIVLHKGYPADLATLLGADYQNADDAWCVRRWDGHCLLTRSGNAWSIQGHDRGVDLTQVPASGSTTHGDAYAGDELIVNLSRLVLELEIADGLGGAHDFLAGDYWGGPVREEIHDVGSPILTDQAAGGIEHHYLKLADFDIAGGTVTLAAPVDDAESRRLSFPRLTKLSAADVGFANSCPGRFAASENVQQALDALCAMSAADLDYAVSDCPGITHPTIRSLFTALSGVTDLSVAGLLDKLLCELRATHLPLDKNATLVNSLAANGIDSIQDALNHLASIEWKRACAWTVGEKASFTTVEEGFIGHAAETDIALCLLPGEHAVANPLEVTGKRCIKITGAGQEASVVSLAQNLSFEAEEIILRDLTLEVLGNDYGLDLSALKVDLQGCHIRRVPAADNVAWAEKFGSTAVDSLQGMAIANTGHIVIAGPLIQPITFGSTKVTPSTGGQFFVAKLPPDLADPKWDAVWAKEYGGPGTSNINDLQLDSQGNVFICGAFNKQLVLGSVTLEASSNDAFVAKISADGSNGWDLRLMSVSATDELFDKGRSLVVVALVGTELHIRIFDAGGKKVVDKAERELVAGETLTALKQRLSPFPDESGLSWQDKQEIIANATSIAGHTRSGNVEWAKQFGGNKTDEALGMAVDATDALIVTGRFFGEKVDFEGAVLDSVNNDTFLLRINSDADATVSVARNFKSDNWDNGYDVVTTGKSETDIVIVLAGRFLGKLTIGTDEWINTSEFHDIYLAGFNVTGEPLWSRHFECVKSAYAFKLAVGADGGIAMIGSFQEALSLGPFKLTDLSGEETAFVAKLDGDGNVLWARSLPAIHTDSIDTAIDAQGNVLIVGYFAKTTDLGGGELVSNKSDSIVAKFRAVDGAHVCSQHFSCTDSDHAGHVAIDTNDNVLVGGGFSGAMSVGDIRIGESSPGRSDIYLANLYNIEADRPLLKIQPKTIDTPATVNIARNTFTTHWVRPAQSGIAVLNVGPGTGLDIATENVGGRIENNRLDGRIELLTDYPEYLDEAKLLAMLIDSMGQARPLSIGQGQPLTLRGNQALRILSKIDYTVTNVMAFQSLFILDNILAEKANSFLGASVTASANHFERVTETERTATIAGSHVTLIGNLATTATATLGVLAQNYNEAGNLLDVVPLLPVQ